MIFFYPYRRCANPINKKKNIYLVAVLTSVQPYGKTSRRTQGLLLLCVWVLICRDPSCRDQTLGHVTSSNCVAENDMFVNACVKFAPLFLSFSDYEKTGRRRIVRNYYKKPVFIRPFSLISKTNRVMNLKTITSNIRAHMEW